MPILGDFVLCLNSTIGEKIFLNYTRKKNDVENFRFLNMGFDILGMASGMQQSNSAKFSSIKKARGLRFKFLWGYQFS